MSPSMTDVPALPSEERGSRQAQHQGLRDVHQRLVGFVAAQTSLSKATLALADSVVDFYSPEVRPSRKYLKFRGRMLQRAR